MLKMVSTELLGSEILNADVCNGFTRLTMSGSCSVQAVLSMSAELSAPMIIRLFFLTGEARTCLRHRVNPIPGLGLQLA